MSSSSGIPSPLSVRGLSVCYGRNEVLHQIDLEIPPGGWLCLIGPNGAGKSSLLASVAGLVAYSGEVLLAGQSAGQMAPRRRARMLALVPQRPIAPVAMTVTDYLLMGRTPYISYLGRESRHDLQVVAETLSLVDLDSYATRSLGSLSGGELQRAVLARALVQETPLLLLDEPTSALDVGYQQQALELVDSWRRERGLTVLSAMHDLTLAGQFADRLVLLSEGSIRAAGPAPAVLSEELINTHYGADVVVLEDGQGGLVVAPRRRH